MTYMYSLLSVSLLSIFVVLNLGDLGSHFLEILLPPPSAYDWCYEQSDSMEKLTGVLELQKRKYCSRTEPKHTVKTH